ncbi:MAG TPA: hypothetical protein VFF65_10585, partial [Phycisphaerales bacterium]|nr:hypothetical protein [Phycisphaerales bacterium]
EKMGIWQLKAEMEKGKLSSFRESVTPEELAAAIKDGKAELSEFRWVKRVLTKEAFERKNEHGGTTRQARPEEAEYSWVREPVVVKWKGATPAAPVTSPPKAKP